MTYIISTVLIINLIALIQMGVDKWLAVKQNPRIPEAQLIAPTLFGGFPGILLGMALFRHKTKKRSFQLKLLFALILFSGLACFIYSRGRI